MKKITLLFILTIACSQLGVFADSSYSVQPYPTPPGIVCEVTGVDYSEDGTLYICTRRGDVWAQKNGDWKRFAYGLHEPMGLLAGPSFAIVSQRPELTRLVDEDEDGTADRYETICDQIAMEANFHQYNYGLVKGKIAGNLYGILSCSGLSKPDGSPASANGFSPIPYRMWSYQITPSGEFRPWSSGLRTANGIGKSPQGELFAADNQGDWVATSMLHHLEEGDFHGHPAALRWDQDFPYPKDPESAPIGLLEKMRKPPRGSFSSWRTGQFTRLSSLGYHGWKVRPVCRSDVYWGYRTPQNHACGFGKSERAVSGSLLFLLSCRRIESRYLPACLFLSRRIDHRPGGRRKLGPWPPRIGPAKNRLFGNTSL